MPKVKSMDRIKKNWVTSTQVKQDEYRAGVESPKVDWAEETAKAEKTYNAGVQSAITRGAFGKGVKKKGTAGWKSATLAKGPERWAQGVALAADDYERGFSPYRAVLEALILPERGPKGDPKNINRVAAVAKALHEKKMAGGGL